MKTQAAKLGNTTKCYTQNELGRAKKKARFTEYKDPIRQG
jgi:hypothetical protein